MKLTNVCLSTNDLFLVHLWNSVNSEFCCIFFFKQYSHCLLFADSTPLTCRATQVSVWCIINDFSDLKNYSHCSRIENLMDFLLYFDCRFSIFNKRFGFFNYIVTISFKKLFFEWLSLQRRTKICFVMDFFLLGQLFMHFFSIVKSNKRWIYQFKS